ncbi:hypothetical protein ACH4L5_14245 [Streptomyces sp. NPDC017405]|uniref:hypothetical protein n=1 Tax=unclassified Streptomyces TaxID=2593676 RepID=UPI00379E3F4E
MLVDQFTARGLSVTNLDDGAVGVPHPLHPRTGEVLRALGGPGRYLCLTDYGYGYEIGQHGDEPATAVRVAHLLGLPRAGIPEQPTTCLVVVR